MMYGVLSLIVKANMIASNISSMIQGLAMPINMFNFYSNIPNIYETGNIFKNTLV